MDFSEAFGSGVDTNSIGSFVQLRHHASPLVGAPGRSAKEVVLEYLTDIDVQHRLGFQSEGLDSLKATIDNKVTGIAFDTTRPWNLLSSVPPQRHVRWHDERLIFRNESLESVVITLQQLIALQQLLDGSASIDVAMAGLRIVLQVERETQSLLITSAVSTLLKDVNLTKERQLLLGSFLREDAPSQQPMLQFISVLGLSGDDVEIADARPLIYDPVRAGADNLGDAALRSGVMATVNLPVQNGQIAAHIVLYDIETRSIVLRRTLVAACMGQAFRADPPTKTGGTTILPNSYAVDLDALCDDVELHELESDASGTRSLAGPRVRVVRPNPLGLEPPSKTPPFNFSSRTNEFAAVSAYYHCDEAIRMIEAFGFDLRHYFRNVQRPISVVHRGRFLLGSAAHDGRAVGAFTLPLIAKGAAQWHVEMRFGLADLSDTWRNPLGIAVDPRWVWHEICHVLILAATGKSEFDFAHSAGDALAAILHDPHSYLATSHPACRGVTFPFVSSPLRRHDRDVTLGWGWSGTMYEAPSPRYSYNDPGGYWAEQILATTLFRLYRSIGGDAVIYTGGSQQPELKTRWASAHYVAYLIVRAIHSLAHTSCMPTVDASIFAAALIDADIGTRKFEYENPVYGTPTGKITRLGGALHKVVRWAFEKQGLYQDPSRPPENAPGLPEPVDVFINDEAERNGEYGFTQQWQAARDWVWIRRALDGRQEDQRPAAGHTNYVYVKVANRGSNATRAAATTVDVLAASGAAADAWQRGGATSPSPWIELSPAAGAPMGASLLPGQSAVVGPFEWQPQNPGPHALLVRTTAPGDRSTIDATSSHACARGPTPIEHIVPFDNNLGYRRWEAI